MKKLILYLMALIITTESIHAKILLITHSYNRPDFIRLQHKTITEFLKDEYDYIVFNDAPSIGMMQQIEQTCSDLNIRCIRVPQQLHSERNDAGYRHIHGIHYALETVGYDFNGIVVLIDSDLFLLKPFSIEQYLQGYDVAGEMQGRENNTTKVRYLSPIFALMNMQTLPNKQSIKFEGGFIKGLACDVGAHWYYYFQNNPLVKVSFFTLNYIPAIKRALDCKNCNNLTCPRCVSYLKYAEFNDNMIKFIHACPDDNIEFGLNNTLFHYRGGSNWNNKAQDYHQIKTKALNILIDELIAAKNQLG